MVRSLLHIPAWLRLWLIFPLAFLNGWLLLLLINYLQPLSSLLVVAIISAFLLNFPIQFLQQRGLPRSVAIALVLLISVLLLVVVTLTVIPLIVDQLSGLVTTLPDLLESGKGQVQLLSAWITNHQLPTSLGNTVDRAISQTLSQLSDILQATSSQLLNVALGAINSFINGLLLLLLTVFMVVTGGQAWHGLFNWLPPSWGTPLKTSIRQTFQTYFAAQALLASFLSLAQTLVFLTLNVPYAVLFGVSIGLTTLIPFASAATILVVSLILALQDLNLGIKVLVTCIIVGQINDNVIAPRLVGKSIGLNPIWLFIALFIGNKVAGVLGLFIAVPIASVIKGMAQEMRVSEASAK